MSRQEQAVLSCIVDSTKTKKTFTHSEITKNKTLLDNPIFRGKTPHQTISRILTQDICKKKNLIKRVVDDNGKSHYEVVSDNPPEGHPVSRLEEESPPLYEDDIILKEIPNSPGFIYAIDDTRGRRIKIGYTQVGLSDDNNTRLKYLKKRYAITYGMDAEVLFVTPVDSVRHAEKRIFELLEKPIDPTAHVAVKGTATTSNLVKIALERQHPNHEIFIYEEREPAIRAMAAAWNILDLEYRV